MSTPANIQTASDPAVACTDLLGELYAAFDIVAAAEEMVLSDDSADIQHLLAVARGCLNKSILKLKRCAPNDQAHL